MILTRKIIGLNHHSSEWLGALGVLLAEIEDNIEANPDIAIESCKSLLESIAKNILKRLDATYSEQEIKKLDVHVLLKRASEILSKRVVDGEYDFVARLISVVHHIAEIRNERGDISHGKILPKVNCSTPQFASSIKSFADGFASYLLTLYLRIDLNYKQPIRYDENPEFNEILDEENPITGVSYSRALYDQDFVAYEEALEAFKSS